MAETKLASASSLKKGSYIILDGVACVVRHIQLSKPGKHGSKKARIEAIGILEGQKKIVVMPGSDNVQVPIINKENAQVLSINGDIANVMDLKTYETFDMKIPEELKNQLKEGDQVLYWVVINDKIIKQVK